MLKRFFWLALATVAGWLIWMWYQQRQQEYTAGAPHFAPPRPLDRGPSFAPLPDQAATAPAAPAGQPGALEFDETVPDALDDLMAAEKQPATRVPGAAEGADPTIDEPQEADEPAGSADEAADVDEAASTVDDPVEADEPEVADTPTVAVAAAGAMTTASENERATAEASAEIAPEGEPLAEEVTGYCVRCKTKRVIRGAHEETTESGRRAARGTCPVCGANMFTFLKDDTDEAEIAAGQP